MKPTFDSPDIHARRLSRLYGSPDEALFQLSKANWEDIETDEYHRGRGQDGRHCFPEVAKAEKPYRTAVLDILGSMARNQVLAQEVRRECDPW